MSQMKTPPIRRASGSVDVYTGLLFAALMVLGAGIFLLATQNIDHSAQGRSDGGMFKLVDKR